MGMYMTFYTVTAEQLNNVINNPKLLDDLLEEVQPILNIDKAWDGINYLLAATEGSNSIPPANTIFGGMPIKGILTDYGPPRYFKVDEVKTLATALKSISLDELRQRYDPQAMDDAGIYPDGIWVREGDVALEYLLEFYQELVAFFEELATNDLAVISDIG